MKCLHMANGSCASEPVRLPFRLPHWKASPETSYITGMGALSEQEIVAGERFAFGQNWQRFLAVLNDQRIEKAEESLCRMLEVPDLHGQTFLDIGCGSG